MELSLKGIKDTSAFEKANIGLPKFNVEAMKKYTDEHPAWLHFGAGNIFRGYIADLNQTLLEKGLAKSGIVAADTFDFEIIDSIYDKFDSLTLFVGLENSGNNTMHVISSISKGLRADVTNEKDFEELKKISANKSLQMVSFTITEKGYAISDMNGKLFPIVETDINNGPENPHHAMAVVTSLVYNRFKNGAAPLALVSMDNCSHNGEKLQNAVMFIAESWEKKGFVSPEFIAYLSDKSKITFPWSMIDKITPRPDSSIEKMLTDIGVENMQPVTTSKKTFIAPFVNAELPQYLVIEDDFPNGRPALEEAGVFMTTRDKVNKSEVMKVTACLNPLHTALAVLGCTLGYKKISDEMNDKDLCALVKNLGYKEAIPVVADPGIINPSDFINEVIEKRLPNPYLPDTPQRIATDTSQKVAIRFGETIKSYAAKNEASKLEYIPLVIASWLRYLLATDDEGNAMELSSDPMLETLQQKLSGIKIYQKELSAENVKALNEILSNKTLFGSDLVELGLSEKVIKNFTKLIAEKGAVRKTIHDAL